MRPGRDILIGMTVFVLDFGRVPLAEVRELHGATKADETAAAPASGGRMGILVRTYDTAGVAPQEMAIALDTAREILNRSSIELHWLDCTNRSNNACSVIMGPSELAVRIAKADDLASASALGYSVIDLDQRGGRLATIFADRIVALASEAEVDAGRLIGRAMAHEMAHMLLGSSSHSGHGLMRARWNRDELRRDTATDWSLSGPESAALQAALAARSRTAR